LQAEWWEDQPRAQEKSQRELSFNSKVWPQKGAPNHQRLPPPNANDGAPFIRGAGNESEKKAFRDKRALFNRQEEQDEKEKIFKQKGRHVKEPKCPLRAVKRE